MFWFVHVSAGSIYHRSSTGWNSLNSVRTSLTSDVARVHMHSTTADCNRLGRPRRRVYERLENASQSLQQFFLRSKGLHLCANARRSLSTATSALLVPPSPRIGRRYTQLFTTNGSLHPANVHCTLELTQADHLEPVRDH